MPKVEGPLKTVLQNPTQVTGVWVRSGQDRTDGAGMILDEPDKATLANGVVSFTAEPGPAVLVLERAGSRPTTLKIMVGTADSSLADAVKAGSVAGHLDSHRLAQLVGMIETTQKNAADAAAAATRTEAVAESVEWQGDRLSVMGQLGPPLTGPKGDPGDGTGDGSGDVLWSELNPVLDGKAAVSHDHTIGQVSGLQDELDGKASSGHSHTVSGITGLQDELDAKAAVGHQHSWGDVTGKPETYPAESHSHPQSEVEGLEAALDGKAGIDHTHSQYADSSRVTALEDSQPIVVSSLPSSPLPGRIYLVTE